MISIDNPFFNHLIVNPAIYVLKKAVMIPFLPIIIPYKIVKCCCCLDRPIKVEERPSMPVVPKIVEVAKPVLMESEEEELPIIVDQPRPKGLPRPSRPIPIPRIQTRSRSWTESEED